jgi:hypothetical protein
MAEPPSVDDPNEKLRADGAREVLTIDAKLASITVVPNGSEGRDPHFPRNLHNVRTEPYGSTCWINSFSRQNLRQRVILLV